MRRRWMTGILLLSLSLMCSGCISDDDDDFTDYGGGSLSAPAQRPSSYQPPGVNGARGAQNQRASGQRAR